MCSLRLVKTRGSLRECEWLRVRREKLKQFGGFRNNDGSSLAYISRILGVKMTDIETRAIDEVKRMHRAIADWVNGRTDPKGFEAEIANYLAPSFWIIQPDGSMTARTEIVGSLARAHGRNPEFRIVIEDAEAIASNDGLVVVSYIERQTGGKLTKASNARRSTGVFRVGDTIQHVLLQETWIEALWLE